MLLTLPMLLLVLPGASHSSLVKTNLGLRVKRGRSACLQEGDLQFHIPHVKDACKVEVVLNEPITQRVGTLSPQVFDCHYLADEVKYVHNGCPILKEDTVKLRLYRFTETETFTEVFSLRVEVMEPDCNIIKPGLKSLVVPEFYGLSDTLDGNVLSFHYERMTSLECSIHVDTHETHLPAHGQLVTGEPKQLEARGDEPESFIPLRQKLDNKARAMCKTEDCLRGLKLAKVTKVPCDEFLLMGLRYQHIDPPSPDVDYIAIRLDLTDTRSGGIYQSERVWIPIHITGAVHNQPPKPAFMSMFLLEVDQFILTPLSTATLDADDGETPKKLLVFNVTKPPSEGFITHLSDHTRPISSFTWVDLNDMLIGYQPPNSSHTQRRNYEAEFEVHDFFFEKSPPIVVHMSVRTADTNAPRVSWNMGLSLLEGQSRPITWDQLQIVDNDNLKAVRVITVDGLQHGRLTLKGGKGFMFTVADIHAGDVRYHHDDSDTTKDFVIFRITDGRHQTRHKFPINILPKDDSPPFLITNTVLELSEGHTALLRGSVLQASDMDSSDDYILFNVTRPPQAGELMKIPGPGLTGYPVSRFLQKDLFHSVVYYRHLGNEVFDDSFEVVLSDFHDPPNLSEPQVIVVHINPVPDQPPKEVPGVTRCLVARETEVIHLTKKQLHFTDPESPDSELTYTVTTPPFFVHTYGGHDAGRLFLVDSIPTFRKDPDAPVLRLFTQHAVNHMKVAYMPPSVDIGPYPQHIQLVLSVTNQQGTTVPGICFNITVLPVDNLAPEVHMKSPSVDEGGECLVGVHHLQLTDHDSMEDQLRVELKKEPQHGAVQLDGFPMKPGQSFTVRDLKSLKVRYRHDSSETVGDTIEFIATDGINPVEFVLEVKVTLVNDEVPVLMPDLKPVLDCAEGQEVIITVEYIYATDVDSDDGGLTYMIARQPHHGVVRKNAVVVDRFVQADIVAGIITYKHTGTEIGLSPRHDTITFVISDSQAENAPLCCGGRGDTFKGHQTSIQESLPLYDLKVTVFPVDSQTPSIGTGEIVVVDEGGVAPITAAHLRALDVDTPLDVLVVSLVVPPQYGYIENTLPSPGFEKSNTGISIASFSYGDILKGHVNYVQSRHQRIEPTADQFILCVSDGKHTSANVPFYILISPINDEVPEFLARNITVQEGHMKQLDPAVINAVDLDIPKNELKFSLIQAPQHGSIMGRTYGSGLPPNGGTNHRHWDAEVLVHDFTMEELRNGMSLMYMHDDSENMVDTFTIQLTDGKHQLQRQVTVNVLPVNDEEPRVVRNNGLEVEAGDARLISSASLFAQDGDTPSQEIVYMLEKVPTQGLLQVKVGSDWVTQSAGMTCTQETVDMNRLRYLHTGPLGATQDFFTFHLLDGNNRSPAQHFHISLKDMEKGNIAIFVKPVKTSRGERVILTTDVLLATDGTDKPEELLYIITVPPRHGHMEYIKHPGVAISTFSQMDIAANLVGYVHDNRGTAQLERLQFVISNGKTTRNGTLEISVETTDRILPSLVSNSGLRVPQGSSMVLTPQALALSDPDTPPADLTFVVAQPPQYGALLRGGVPLAAGGNFTQWDLQEQGVTYTHSGGPSEIDRFAFTASDTTDRGFLLEGRLQTEPVVFTIQIELLDSTAPEVAQLQSLWKAEALSDGRYGIYLSSRELRAQDANTKDEDLTFHIHRPPYFGYLENSATGSFVQQRFTQWDLNRRTIVYVIDPATEALSDSLEFRVSDPLGNTGPSHTLELKWCRVELAGSEYQACEDEGAVSLDILRKGNAELPTPIGRPVTQSSALREGVSKRSWRIEITQDHLEEAEETFEVVLVAPEGALLGSTSKALVKIRDAGKGQCGAGQGPASSSLGGKQVQAGPYPQHGSIHLEALPLAPVDQQVTWTLGDGVSQAVPADVHATVPVEPRKILRVVGNRKAVIQSGAFTHCLGLYLQYHGITSLRVEDETSPSRKGRKANIQVTSRGRQWAPQPLALNQKPVPVPKMNGDSLLPRSETAPKPCVPGLMGLLHFNQSSGRLHYCNGVSWRPWAPTDEMVRGQACGKGWTYHNGYCFLLSTERKATWSTAFKACRESLVSISSKADMDWLWDFSERKPFWIGLNDRESRGRWEWAGGEPVTYTNWRKSPARGTRKGTKRCVLVWRKAKWQPRDCKAGKGHRYVCYLKT
uniref:C-type lectin domain-containing protein n=1 Tax=Esox lucius TaxID=8010 RepID=A0A6Q2ZGQ8_ESOLU